MISRLIVFKKIFIQVLQNLQNLLAAPVYILQDFIISSNQIEHTVIIFV